MVRTKDHRPVGNITFSKWIEIYDIFLVSFKDVFELVGNVHFISVYHRRTRVQGIYLAAKDRIEAFGGTAAACQCQGNSDIL